MSLTAAEEIKRRAQEYNQRMQEQTKQFQKELLAFFHAGTKELFEAYPNLVAFSWSQGTPGYCDGEPCRFRVITDTEAIRITIDPKFAEFMPGGQVEDLGFEELEPWEEDGQEPYEATRYKGYNPITKKSEYETYTAYRTKYKPVVVPGIEEFAGVLEMIEGFLSAFDSTVFQTFSDPDYGATITLYRNGNVTVSEYDFGY